MTALVIDCETTGLTMPGLADLSKQPFIIEFAAARIEKGKIKKKFEALIYPGVEVSAEITKITGITNEMLKGKQRFKDVLPDIEKMFKGADTLFAHNAPFDCACIGYELSRLGIPFGATVAGMEGRFYPPWWPENVVCTVQEYKHEFGRRAKLTELYERKMGKPLNQKHRALGDVLALAEIIVKEGLA